MLWSIGRDVRRQQRVNYQIVLRSLGHRRVLYQKIISICAVVGWMRETLMNNSMLPGYLQVVVYSTHLIRITI